MAILVLVVAVSAAAESGLSWACDGQHILLSWAHHNGKQLRLYRCTQAFLREDLKDASFPIVSLGLIDGTAYLDDRVSPGTTYFYAGETDDGWWYQANPATVPAQKLPQVVLDAWILIDKLQYCLEVHSHGTILKRYPVTFGTGVQKRKLHQDRASTPEGRYQITACQPKAQWHKAFDINYPTAVDKARLNLLAPGQDIGGEIQIHGGGIDDNWTWGCIGMRDADIDELFRHPEIGRDTVVWIVGRELTYEDLECDEAADPINPSEVGRWQRDQGLPITCIQDRITRSRLRRNPQRRTFLSKRTAP